MANDEDKYVFKQISMTAKGYFWFLGLAVADAMKELRDLEITASREPDKFTPKEARDKCDEISDGLFNWRKRND